MLSFYSTTTNHFLLSNSNMKKLSTRYVDATRQTGGGSIVISHKPSKKLKTLSSVDGMDKSTCSKRVKLPKKLLDDGHTIDLASVPRKLRSVPSAVTKKRYSNTISRCQMSSTDGNKKLKLDPEEQQYSIMKDEEEAIAGLLGLAGIDNNTHEIKLNNKIPEARALKSEYLVQKYAQIDLSESRNNVDVIKDLKDVTDGNNTTRKRCFSHVYICQIIKNLQITKGKMVNSLQESKIETTPQDVINVNRGINLNEPIMVSKTVFQEQPSGCKVQPYFGNPFCDPSQWSRPLLPTQQMWMNTLMYEPQQQQLPLKMQLGHHPSSGYDETGALFRVDSSPTLKLALR